MSDRSRAWAQIHLSVFLWGFTAILGKLITLPALPLVWWRMLLVGAALTVVPRVRRGVGSLSTRQRAVFAGIGAVLAFHWLTFYGAIKLSNASVAATSLALGPVFMAFIEPLATNRPFDRRELWFGLAALPGVALVVGGVPASMYLGVAIGAFSALLVTVFGSLNKRFIAHADALTVTFLEMSSGCIVLTGVALLFPSIGSISGWPSAHDATLLVVLVFGCTLLPFTLSLVSLRQLSAFDATLAVNLEPVYAIVLAAILFGEQRELSVQFYLGVAIILAAVIGHPWLRTARAEQPPPPRAG